MKYLLDTNILSEPLKSQPEQKILTKLQKHQGEVATAAPVFHEMWFGCYRLRPSRKRDAIEEYLRTVIWANVPILPYDYLSAERHALERARLTAAGKTPGFVDGQIASIAITNDLVLVTFNTDDFKLFQDLSIESWL